MDKRAEFFRRRQLGKEPEPVVDHTDYEMKAYSDRVWERWKQAERMAGTWIEGWPHVKHYDAEGYPIIIANQPPRQTIELTFAKRSAYKP